MNSLIILGCGSFIGRELLKNFNYTSNDVLVKAVVREIPGDVEKFFSGVEWIKVNIINSSSLIKIFSKNDIVINLTYIRDNDKNTNICLINNIIEACVSSKVSRLVHCSTASVFGDIQAEYINELTQCSPKTPYEKVKMAIEAIILKASLREIDVGILRPTAVVGYGGKNLEKLANSLMYGNKFINYIKKCAMGKIPMHLVPVRNVADALFCLALTKKKLDKNIFLVSSDDDVDNNFEKVEAILINELGLKVNKFPKIFLPLILQKLLFKVTRRNNLGINSIYDSSKIREYGFKPIDTVKEAIRQFSHSVRGNNFNKNKINK